MLGAMFGLSVTVTAAILAVVLAAIGLAYLLFGWLRKRSWRVMLRGAGFVLMPLGLLAIGIMRLIVNGLNALIDWANATAMTALIMFGVVLAGIGVVAYLVGSFWPPVLGDEAAARRQAMHDKRLATLQARASQPAPSAGTSKPTPVADAAPQLPVRATPPAPAQTPPAMSADDKEVDDILRRHGIN